MKHYGHGSIVVAAALLIGCQSDREAGPPVEGMVRAEALKTPVYGEPITPAGSEVVWVPFSVDLDRSKVERLKSVPTRVPYLQRTFAASPAASMAFRDSSTFESATVTGLVGDVDWNNVILFDRGTGTSRLLLVRRGVVTRFYYPRSTPWPAGGRVFTNGRPEVPPPPPQWPEKLVLLGIADKDTNGDGFIDAADASAAYSCDPSGQNLTRLTPADEQFQSAEVEPGGKWVYLATTANPTGTFGTDKDGEKDEVRYYAVDASNPAKAAAMLPADVRAAALKIVTQGKPAQ